MKSIIKGLKSLFNGKNRIAIEDFMRIEYRREYETMKRYNIPFCSGYIETLHNRCHD